MVLVIYWRWKKRLADWDMGKEEHSHEFHLTTEAFEIIDPGVWSTVHWGCVIYSVWYSVQCCLALWCWGFSNAALHVWRCYPQLNWSSCSVLRRWMRALWISWAGLTEDGGSQMCKCLTLGEELYLVSVLWCCSCSSFRRCWFKWENDPRRVKTTCTKTYIQYAYKREGTRTTLEY